MFKVLNGPTYSLDDRPPCWENETALMISEINMELAPIADFPLIEDFEIRLEIDTSVPEFGHQIYFFSVVKGYIAAYRSGNHAERWLTHDPFIVPSGNFERPFHAIEQTWDMVIAAKDDFVYILQGIFEDSAGYHIWFKVRKDRYISEWQKAVAACREAFLMNDK